MEREDPELLAARIVALRDRIAPLVPDIDPGDLMSILECWVRPFGTGRRFLLREIRPGVHVA
jgi:hypothetical protein